MARPTKYNKALANRLCQNLAAGESLRSICSSDKFPSVSTVLLWVVDGKHPEFSEQYVRAREAAGYAHADRIVETIEKLLANELKPDVAKAVMDGLKWSAERMSPKAHSPRHQVAGPEEGPIEAVTEIRLVAAGEGDVEN
ncbi:hypothetical protein [Vreelandella massiliensis]|uniref:terminase small subunit-like protein n=1 Tax=Vreelandella massiliensis TaxID=1816686 RepID=UPI00096A3A93|nr:hypothetical protein [Halomonas massiliensis]